jgi:predicted ArsR family transcriptional regulator
MKPKERALRPEHVHEVVLHVRKELEAGAKPKDAIAQDLIHRFHINRTEAYQELGILIERGVIQSVPVMTGKGGRPKLLLCLVEQK